MDASDAVYYPFRNDADDPGNDPKRCSVRGCTQLVTDGSQNKMCDACRGRHRIYASTKRARRKLEKAAVATVGATRIGQEPLGVAHSDNGISSPIVTASSWVSENTDIFHQEISSPNSHPSFSGPSSSISPSLLSSSWNQSIDPRFFAQDTLTSPSRHLPLHQTSSSSELANALTLPLPRPQQPGPVPGANHDPEEQEEEDQEEQSTPASSEARPQDSGEGPTRFCSVKGCKSVLPASYGLKMCPPCRTRYRTYGNTKRAKWKTEREAFDREMAGLRVLEDKRRELEGLPALADNPDELRAWELSIIDEQIPVPDEVASHMAPPASSTITPQQLASGSVFPASYGSPMVMAGVYPAIVGSIEIPHTVSPYSHLNDPSLISGPGPLPARMCTVSHCHKILPGYYRYKRCEQHRLQNRHHSKLKRVREKGVKALGSDEGAQILEGVSTSSHVVSEGSNDVALNENVQKLKPGKDEKGKGKAKEESNSTTVAGVVLEMTPGFDATTTTQTWPNMTIPKPDVIGIGIGHEAKSRAKMQLLSRFSCATDDCENLLTPGIRWRTCEECRDMDRLRKFTVRAELKAAENVYWKGVAQSLSAARKANGVASASGTIPENIVPYQTDAPVVPSPVGGDEDDDADGDYDVGGEEEEESAPAPLVYAPGSGNTTDSPPVPSTAFPSAPVAASPSAPVITSTSVPAITSTSVPASAAPEVPAQVPAPPSVPTSVENLSKGNDNTTKTQTYYRRERMQLDPPMHLSPTFNSLIKQQRAQTDAVPIVNGKFSKFRVELIPGPSVLIPTLSAAPVGGNYPVFQGFLSTPVAPGDVRMLDVSRATTEAHTVKQITSPDSDNVGSTSANAAELDKAVPTATIPTSAPFIYKAPVKKPSKEEKATTSNAKGKRKSASKDAAPNPGMPASLTQGNSISAPTSFGPYGFPPSYPYYPYYMPPYPYSPLPPMPPTPAIKGSSQPQASSSTAPLPGSPNFYPYPYPPQPYGFGSPPGGYLYLPPRYTTAAYNATSGQQPYPGPPPPPPTGPYKGFPYYAPMPGSSVSAPPPQVPVVNTGSTSASQEPQEKPPPPKPTTKPPEAEVAKFTYYHLGTDSFSPMIPEKPIKKRRKVDPDYLEKHKALQAEKLALIANTASPVPPDSMLEASMEDVLAASLKEVMERTTDSGTEPQEVQSNGVSLHPCAAKTCRRSVAADALGKICEKCKLRFKKHQAKTKRKFKLEPRKFVLAKDALEAKDHAEAVQSET